MYKQRNLNIFQGVINGATCSVIADHYAISQERVRQITRKPARNLYRQFKPDNFEFTFTNIFQHVRDQRDFYDNALTQAGTPCDTYEEACNA